MEMMKAYLSEGGKMPDDRPGLKRLSHSLVHLEVLCRQGRRAADRKVAAADEGTIAKLEKDVGTLREQVEYLQKASLEPREP